jgi:hypothetical protein
MACHETVIEFVGLPGAGKTSVAREVCEGLATDAPASVAMPDRSDYRRRQLSLLEMARLDVAYALPLLRYRLRRLRYDVRRARPGLWTIRHSWNQSRYPIVLLDVMRHRPHRYYVLDEWLVHRTIDESIRRYDGEVDFSLAFGLLRLAPYRRVYVYVHVDTETACRRILDDVQPFRRFAQSASADEIRAVLRPWEAQLRELHRAIGEHGFECIELDGCEPVAANAQRVLEQVRATSPADETLH